MAKARRRNTKSKTVKARPRTRPRPLSIKEIEALRREVVALRRSKAERKRTEEAEARRAERLWAQQAALVELAKSETIHDGELAEAFRAVTEIAARAMPVGRASVWLYDEDRSAIRLRDLYELERDRHSAGTVLFARDYPAYFRALETEKQAIDAHDAHADLRTREYSESYLTPLGIGAMLDVPIRLKGQVIGVICYEHLGGPRTWTPEEQSFAGSLATKVTLAMEVHERRKADEALRESEERFRALYDDNPAILFTVDSDGTVLSVNRFGTEQLGYRVDELVGRSVLTVFHEEDRQKAMECLHVALQAPAQVHQWELRKVRKDGRVLWVREDVRIIQDSAGKLLALVVCEDITEHRRTDEALRRAEEKYRSIFENAVEGIFQTTPDGRYLNVNPALARLYGYESSHEVIEAVTDIRRQVYVDPDRRSEFERMLKGHDAVIGFEAQVYRKDGSVIWVSESARAVRDRQGTLLCYEGTVEDITERKRLEQQLLQSQKMEAIGRLAGGIAHDFNNLLTAILGYSELLLSGIGSEETQRRNTEQIKKAAERAAALTRQLLAFSRRQVLTLRVLDLNDVVVAMEPMLRRLIGEDITLVTVLDRALGHTKADVSQIEQVIMNLVVNASDAMPHGGVLTVETANAELDQTYVDRYGLIPPGACVKLTVSDTGSGMDAETQAHIFEPFFTTKDPGRGTGLGLSTVYGVIKQSGGYIWVDSEPRRGTTFKIYLPRVEEAVEAVEQSVVPGTRSRGQETILLVEDDEVVRAVAEMVLRTNGYTVLTARDCSEAVAIHTRQAEPIHLMVTDVVMPGISGRELAERLVPLRPDMKVLYMSGYTDDAVVRYGVLVEEAAYLQKPFTPDVLLQRVRQMLG